MKMLGQQDISNDLETEHGSQFIQGSYPPVLIPLRIEDAGTLIRAAGQVMRVLYSVIMLMP